MLKAIFLDMDETLCDTTKANIIATNKLTNYVSEHFTSREHAEKFSNDYLKGIYKDLPEDLIDYFFPITNEESFRSELVQILFKRNEALNEISLEKASDIRAKYDHYRIEQFDFFGGTIELLRQMREKLTLVVITNGPIYSQKPKVERVSLVNHVDHIIIGGMEPEEKPHASIFSKALKLSNTQPNEVIHVGDSVNADIIGAKKSGIKSVWINPNKKTNTEADYSIENIVELPKVLAQLNIFL